MKFTVIIPSRGRPQGLATVLAYLMQLASKKHEIVYVVGCDHDDPQTLNMATLLGVKTHVFKPRLGSLGEMVNIMAAEHPADAYFSLADDVGPLTPNWDDNLARAWVLRPDGVWFWHTNNDALYAVISEKWRAAAGRIFTDHFPCWWDDCWLKMLWLSISGVPHLVGFGSHLNDGGTDTHRMRDLVFWEKFYWWLLPERKAEAEKIRKALGWQPVQYNVTELPKPGFDAATSEDQQGDRAPPTPEYLSIKARAAAMMAAQKETPPVGSGVPDFRGRYNREL